MAEKLIDFKNLKLRLSMQTVPPFGGADQPSNSIQGRY